MELRATKRLLWGLLIVTGCGRQELPNVPTGMLHVTRLVDLSITSSMPAHPLRWPQFLLVQGERSFVWGENGIYHVEIAGKGPVLEQTEMADLSRGMDRLIAAAQAPSGTLAVVDVSGDVAIRSPRSDQVWRFEAQFQNHPGGLAVTESRVYLLLQDEPEDGNAVIGYDFKGTETGRWGKMPVDGITQARLGGGGIAACPDGSIFYSYINSPQIFRLAGSAGQGVRTVGKPPTYFAAVSPWRVRHAYREERQRASVAPLVRLGLGASRVMTLLCSQEGLLLRQVAQPRGEGAFVEVWDPISETLLGTIPVGGRVLLGVRDRVLYLGARSDGQSFRLERIRYEIHRPPSARVTS